MSFERLWWKKGEKGTPPSCLTNDHMQEHEIKEGWVFFFFALFDVFGVGVVGVVQIRQF